MLDEQTKHRIASGELPCPDGYSRLVAAPADYPDWPQQYALNRLMLADSEPEWERWRRELNNIGQMHLEWPHLKTPDELKAEWRRQHPPAPEQLALF